MAEVWYAVLWVTLAIYIVLDGRNFGAGALHLIVAKTSADRRRLISALGPLWTWHEVWLIAVAGILLIAFPKFIAVAFPAYYLALFLILWSFILRGISLEVGGHIDDKLWQTFWDTVFAVANILLALLFGVALGNEIRGVPLDATGKFHMALFTDFDVGRDVGLLDWYTLSVGVFALITLAAHGATHLMHNADGPLRERSTTFARYLWITILGLMVVVTVETGFVRPQLFEGIYRNPLAWLAVIVATGGAAAIFVGLRNRRSLLAIWGSSAFIGGLIASIGAGLFPVMLYSTLINGSVDYSYTVYNSAADSKSMAAAVWWWPIAMALSLGYAAFVYRHFHGKQPASVTRGEP